MVTVEEVKSMALSLPVAAEQALAKAYELRKAK